jgi:hypothetical protein
LKYRAVKSLNMSTLNLWQETNPVGVGNSLVMAIYKATAPTVLVASFQLPGPYTGQTQLHSFTGLQNVVYNYVLYESPDGGADGTQRNAFSVQPNANAYNVRDPLTLLANTSPYFASGTNFYGPDPSLIGWNWYPDIPGTGIFTYGVDYVKTVNGTPTTQDDTTANGYKYLATGYSIGDGEKSVIVFLPQLQATSTSVSGTIVSLTTLLTSNTTLTNSAAGQAFLLQGGGPALSITLPGTLAMPDNEPIFINSAGGSHVNAGLLPQGGDVFEWYNNANSLGSATRATVLYLGQCESIGIYKWTYPDSTRKWLIFQGGEGMRMVGEIIYDYSLVPLNTVFANGQLLSRTAYARLWAWVQAAGTNIIFDSFFNTTSTVNGVVYQPYWGYFTYGDGSTTFRVPKLWASGYLRAKAGVAGSGNSGYGYSGDFTPPSVLAHIHTPMHGFGTISGGAGNLYLARLGGGGRYSGGGGDQFGGTSSPDETMSTGGTGGFATNANGEQLTANIGAYALIRT